MEGTTCRVCGSCALCCRLTAIPELRKPYGEWCYFCGPEHDHCRIYEQRPGSCARYGCLWLTTQELPLEARPDFCGVMFEKLIESYVYLALVDPEKPDAWRGSVATGIMQKLLDGGNPIVIKAGTEKHMLMPEGVTEVDVVAEIEKAMPKYGLRTR